MYCIYTHMLSCHWNWTKRTGSEYELRSWMKFINNNKNSYSRKGEESQTETRRQIMIEIPQRFIERSEWKKKNRKYDAISRSITFEIFFYEGKLCTYLGSISQKTTNACNIITSTNTNALIPIHLIWKKKKQIRNIMTYKVPSFLSIPTIYTLLYENIIQKHMNVEWINNVEKSKKIKTMERKRFSDLYCSFLWHHDKCEWIFNRFRLLLRFEFTCSLQNG